MIFPETKYEIQTSTVDFIILSHLTQTQDILAQQKIVSKSFLPPLYSIFVQISPNILETPGFL